MNRSMNVAPQLNEEQKTAILEAAGRKVGLTICRIENEIEEKDLHGAGNAPVYGAFVTLKRFRQVRAQSGCMGDSMPLWEALNTAAHRAALEDLRFPPLENHEIHDLQIEVWVLYSPELIGSRPEERPNFVEIGQHGLLVVHGEHRGLILPNTAAEKKLDARGFLEEACRKAHLPANAWQEDETMVFRFQGQVFSGNLKDYFPQELTHILQPPKGPGRKDLAQLADHCYRNIIKQFENRIPDYYLPAAYDGKISGACLRVRLNSLSADCAQLHLNHPQPLQATLLGLSQNAALAMRQNKLQPADLQKTSLCIFWDPKNLGNTLTADVSGLDTRRFGILALRFGKWILGYAPGKDPASILEDVLKNSRFDRDESTTILSVQVACTDIAFMTTTVQKPMVKDTPRPAIAAGAFYPANVREMETMRNGFFSSEPVEKKAFSGAVIPHGGWPFAGKLLAQTLEKMELRNRILIFAPKYQALGVDWGVCPDPRWNLPGRPMEGDINLSRAMTEAVDSFQLDSLAHSREHGIEVVLPFLSYLAPGAHVVGTVMQGGARKLENASKQLAAWLQTLPQCPTLLAASDLSLYADPKQSPRLDESIVEAMAALDPEKMLALVQEKNAPLTGVLPCAFLMMTLRELGLLNRSHLVGHTQSIESKNGVRKEVGFCGMLFE